MSRAEALKQDLEKYQHLISEIDIEHKQVTVTVNKSNLLAFCQHCIEDKTLAFEQLIDVCGIDYLHYGLTEWPTEETTETGFSRGKSPIDISADELGLEQHRFASVYHLLSIKNNQRLRIKVFLDEDMRVPSVVPLWPAANWFEREAFDLYGILFDGHPDLRRILTDYGFVGHPFRKDFPLSGHVEVRYDATAGRVVYEPVDIEPRVGVAKVIRDDNRYLSGDE